MSISYRFDVFISVKWLRKSLKGQKQCHSEMQLKVSFRLRCLKWPLCETCFPLGLQNHSIWKMTLNFFNIPFPLTATSRKFSFLGMNKHTFGKGSIKFAHMAMKKQQSIRNQFMVSLHLYVPHSFPPFFFK